MANQVVVVTGFDELNRKLALLSSPRAKQAIRKASRAALRPVAEQAKNNAPRRTGRLSRSVKVRALSRSRVRVGSRVTSSGSTSQFQGKTYYGGFQEYGWKAGRRAQNSDIGLAKGARRSANARRKIATKNNARRKVAGTEFMKRAADSKREAALAIYRAETLRWVQDLTQ